MSAKIAVLGLVIEEPGPAHRLTAKLRQRLASAEFVDSNVYSALTRLERDGLVSAVASHSAGEPARGAPDALRGIAARGIAMGRTRAVRVDQRAFQATPAGVRHFEEWLLSSSPAPPLRDELHMKIALCQPHNLPRLIELVHGQELVCLGRVQELKSLLRAALPSRAGALVGSGAGAHQGRRAVLLGGAADVAAGGPRIAGTDPRRIRPRDPAAAGGVTVGALLALKEVSKSYWRGDSEVRVLRDVSLDVRAGEFLAVWGPRGSGKTTLLKLAARLELPDRGTVCFGGADLATLSEAQHARLMREKIGWVRRTGPRSNLRMLDYVALPLLAEHGHRDAYARAGEAIERVGMAAHARQRWESLCDGERALIAIAHGIARAPRLLLVDDPTAALDVLERERVTELLRSLADEEAIAVLMAVPDMPAAMRAHQIASLGAGRLTGVSEAPELPVPGRVIPLRGRQHSA